MSGPADQYDWPTYRLWEPPAGTNVPVLGAPLYVNGLIWIPVEVYGNLKGEVTRVKLVTPDAFREMQRATRKRAGTGSVTIGNELLPVTWREIE